MIQIGDLLDNTYEMKGQIGMGGGGEIFLAWHTRLQKDVVLKRIRDNVKGKLDDRAETDILKNLRHSYLPQVFDFLVLDGAVYTVMDFIMGRSFAEELADGKKFTQKQVIKWAGQLSEALAYLHKQKPPIIHSDIKPGNVMLTPDEDICLIDFNISRLFDGTGSVPLGRSNGYAAPEQYPSAMRAQTPRLDAHNAPQYDNTVSTDVDTTSTQLSDAGTMIDTTSGGVAKHPPISALQENAAWIDERTDIYGLGATLYHILTGQQPNTAIYGVKPLRECGVPVSDGLNHIIEKAMESDPKKRFSSAEEMLRAVRNIHKLDKAYKRQIRRQEAIVTGIALLFAGSVLTSFFGWNMMKQERLEKYDTLVSQARGATDDADYEQALLEARQAQLLYPMRVDAYTEEALALFKRGDYAECIEFTERTSNSALLLDTENEKVLRADLDFIRANAWFEQENYQQAIPAYQSAIHRNAENGEYYRDFAISYARVGAIDQAQEILKTAIEKKLDDASVLLVDGEISRGKKAFLEAESAFLKVLEKTSDNYLVERAYLICAQVYAEWGEHQAEEIALLERAIQALPSDRNFAVTELLGDAYSRQGQISNDTESYQKAIDCFQSLISRGYTRFYLMHNIAILYQNMGYYEKAEQELFIMKKKFPDNYKVYMQLAFLYSDEQLSHENEGRNYDAVYVNYQLAKKLYEQSSKNNATDPQMLMLEDLISEISAGGWLNGGA